MGKSDKVRVGVFGVGRGMSFANQAQGMENVELVAVCDMRQKALDGVMPNLPGVTAYTDYDEFLGHEEMDAVIMANYATEHAPAAIKALEHGLHVQSESLAVKTMAEAVALVRAVEKSGCIYMYAENYCYATPILEMRRLYKQGEIGEFRYGEGEYVHPLSPDEMIGLSPTWDHWRNWIPATYYCTHSMSPLMYVTRTRPTKVSGFVVPYDFDDPTCTQTGRRSDLAGILMVQMDNGGYCKLLKGQLKGHAIWCSIHGTKGTFETLRHGDGSMLRLRKDHWDRESDDEAEKIYTPELTELQAKAAASGHGGGDFWMLYEFVEAIRKSEQPYLDVYTGLQMTVLGILGYRSALENNCSIEVPSFKLESELKKFENDNWSFDPADAGPGQPYPSILGNIEKSPEVREAVEKRQRELRPDWYDES